MADQSSIIHINKFEDGKISGDIDTFSGVSLVQGRSHGKSYGSVSAAGSVSFEYKIRTVDYNEKFQNKREALHDMVADGDGFTKEEIHDLVLTANKAVLQESKDD